MRLGLKGKKALVTGASRGIGEAIAKSLAAEGARVALAARSGAALNSVLAAMGGKAEGHAAFAMDLAGRDGPRSFCAKLKSRFGSPDIIVHSLGGSLEVRDPLAPLADWRKVFRLNFEVAVEINNFFVPEMKRKAWGRIIHISSVSGNENLGSVTYCSAKAALNAYTKSLGRVLAPDGIIVCSVCPGMVFSPGGSWDRAIQKRPEYVKKTLNEQMPTRRFARPEEISSVVAFLCSRHSSQCSGSIVSVDGGSGRSFAS